MLKTPDPVLRPERLSLIPEGWRIVSKVLHSHD
jgi:hypothetical protein